ncbi:hypothetical protein [Micromonospora sp. NBC_01813]|uniref:hypothetical protein n=1 Tax=Micromonospora sp. NBC_01813 TaxID=2975988 RepID=UPI002DD7EF7A|nr:hypothetical protein [Micromonospora sp. NBC_01813]WSA06631.1 hypothetical protein OG958_20310 [Micromonospora sp. NBC_01813]
MSGTVADVIAQLTRASTGLSSAAATALRAQQEAVEAHQALTAASAGATAHAVTNATTEWKTAADKAAKVARLLMEAVRHLNTYANRISPGSAPAEATLTGPTGEELLADTTRRSDARRGPGSFLNRMARNAENVQDTGKSLVTAGQEAIRIGGGPRGTAGTQTSHTGTPSAVVPTHPARIDPPEAGGHILVLGLIAGITVNRTVNVARRQIARYLKRDHERKTE